MSNQRTRNALVAQFAAQRVLFCDNLDELLRGRQAGVLPLSCKMPTCIEMLEKDATAALTKLNKQFQRLRKKHVELLAYDEKLRHYADMRISLDLDDGVKVNYGRFGDLLAEVKAVTGGKED